MNKHTFLILGLGASLLFASCRKTDVPASEALTEKTTTTAAAFRSLSTWESQPEEQYTVHSANISDAAITGDVAANGLVLVFKKSGGATSALPAEEKATGGSYFWYYQVSEGGISVLADTYGSAAKPGADESFAYFVIPASKLAQLETDGHPKSELMSLSYESAAALLK